MLCMEQVFLKTLQRLFCPSAVFSANSPNTLSMTARHRWTEAGKQRQNTYAHERNQVYATCPHAFQYSCSGTHEEESISDSWKRDVYLKWRSIIYCLNSIAPFTTSTVTQDSVTSAHRSDLTEPPLPALSWAGWIVLCTEHSCQQSTHPQRIPFPNCYKLSKELFAKSMRWKGKN